MRRIFAVSIALIFVTDVAQAQTLMAPIPSGNEFQPELLNGKPADPKVWPVNLQFQSAGGLCTSTIIGEKVVLTAGHCVANQAKAKVFYNNTLTSVTCHHHPQYKGAACLTAQTTADIKGCTADISLCVADAPFPSEVAGQPVKFETVNNDTALLKKDGPVTLLGFGCTVAGGGVSSILRVGGATVTSLSVPGASVNPANTMQEYIIAQGGAALCQGDSGGTAFNKPDPDRKVVAVNSRGNIETISFLTSTSDPNIQDFFKDFSGPPRNVEICGVTPGAKNCR
jgi:Trypsin